MCIRGWNDEHKTKCFQMKSNKKVLLRENARGGLRGKAGRYRVPHPTTPAPAPTSSQDQDRVPSAPTLLRPVTPARSRTDTPCPTPVPSPKSGLGQGTVPSWGTPYPSPPSGELDKQSKNITLPRTSCAGGNNGLGFHWPSAGWNWA